MRVIVGYGNDLRGEDAFGVDAINLLQKQKLKDTKLISEYQLTPELCLRLLDADEIIFIDAAFANKNHYAIACDIMEQQNVNLSHHISPKVIISLLNNIYNKFPRFYIYSMLTNEFDTVLDVDKYNKSLKSVVDFLK